VPSRRETALTPDRTFTLSAGVGIPGVRRRPWHARAIFGSLTSIAVVLVAGTAAVVKELTSSTPNAYLLTLYG
jgi:hypothetical protein